MNCVACQRQPMKIGLLCEDCRDDIAAPPGMVPEQIISSAATATDAMMFDGWGRPHGVDANTPLGHQPVVHDPSTGSTLRSMDRIHSTLTNHGEINRASTHVGIPTRSIRLHEPRGGGGGVVEIDDHQVQFSATQFELFGLLARRMVGDAHQPYPVRGYVRSCELASNLSWRTRRTRDPTVHYIKQLVCRMRRSLIRAEIGNLIESRHRFGYRLRVIPQL